jgi:uncharacterized radical SAM superfamily Fe-S cluster-containing enzyme
LPDINAPELGYENVFRLLIVYFQDARDFDLRAVKKSCIHFAQPSGELIPFETFKLFYRDGARDRLGSIRAKLEVPGDLAATPNTREVRHGRLSVS